MILENIKGALMNAAEFGTGALKTITGVAKTGTNFTSQFASRIAERAKESNAGERAADKTVDGLKSAFNVAKTTKNSIKDKWNSFTDSEVAQDTKSVFGKFKSKVSEKMSDGYHSAKDFVKNYKAKRSEKKAEQRGAEAEAVLGADEMIGQQTLYDYGM